MIKSRRMRYSGHVACMGEKRNAYGILVGKPDGKRPLGRPDGKRPLGRPRRWWVDNSKMDLREIAWNDVAQGRDQWMAFVSTVIDLQVP
jgi:hypothetical protein